jgi:protein ImuB
VLDELVERLRARLGDEAVHGLCAVEGHRPECASAAVPVGFVAPMAAVAPARRPLELFDPPEALREIDGRPARRGQALTLLAGPERIESGWWDQGERLAEDMVTGATQDDEPSLQGRPAPGDVRRDYFLARSPQGESFWIYRDSAGWWAQGRGL